MRLGPNLRAARTRRGLTVAELAQAGGLSKGFVSQVENDKTSPSLDTLERLAAALDITIVDLLRGADEAPPAPHVVAGALDTPDLPGSARRPARPGRLLAGGQVAPAVPAVREISPPGAVLRSFVLDLPPGTAVGEPGHRHEGDESLVVLSGALDAEQAGETIHLAAGDALTWTPGQRHRLLNRRPDPARVLVTLVAPATLGTVGVLGSPAPRPVAAPPELRPLRLVQMRAERARRAAR